MNQAIVIGLTGGIGSGKSTVAKICAAKNIPIYIADDIAKQLYTTDPMLKQALLDAFGTEVYLNGELNRTYLSQLVFGSKDKLSMLNSLVHPAVARHFQMWVQTHHNHAMVMKEAAILFESGSYRTCDCTITINCAESIRLRRVMQRDHADENAIRKRMEAQWTDEQRTEAADYYIVNDGSQLLIPQVDKVLALIEQRFFGAVRNH